MNMTSMNDDENNVDAQDKKKKTEDEDNIKIRERLKWEDEEYER